MKDKALKRLYAALERSKSGLLGAAWKQFERDKMMLREISQVNMALMGGPTNGNGFSASDQAKKMFREALRLRPE